MGVYIKGMEMPKSCGACPLHKPLYNTQYCTILNKNCAPFGTMKDWCPLVPVPLHGRLGDLDKLEMGLRNMAKYQVGERQQGILGCCETIRLTPTIIESEG